MDRYTISKKELCQTLAVPMSIICIILLFFIYKTLHNLHYIQAATGQHHGILKILLYGFGIITIIVTGSQYFLKRNLSSSLQSLILQVMPIPIIIISLLFLFLFYIEYFHSSSINFYQYQITIDFVLCLFVLIIVISLGSQLLSGKDGSNDINFLFKLPISRKSIVREKIIVHFLITLFSFIVFLMIFGIFSIPIGYKYMFFNSDNYIFVQITGIVIFILILVASYLIGASCSLFFNNFINAFACSIIFITIILLCRQPYNYLVLKMFDMENVQIQHIPDIFYFSIIVSLVYLIFTGLLKRKEVTG